jgi:hypothetical protein
LDALSQITLVPGQRFECTISQEALTDLIRGYPDVPCKDVRVTLDNGAIVLDCWMPVKLSATGTARAEGCRPSFEITKGTVGFRKVVQDLIDAQLETLPYDAVCIERLTVDDGRATIAGYMR